MKIQVTNGREAGRVFVIPYEGVTAKVHQEGKGKILRCFYLLCFTLASLLFEVSACLSFCVNIRSPFAAFLCQVTSVDYFLCILENCLLLLAFHSVKFGREREREAPGLRRI